MNKTELSELQNKQNIYLRGIKTAQLDYINLEKFLTGLIDERCSMLDEKRNMDIIDEYTYSLADKALCQARNNVTGNFIEFNTTCVNIGNEYEKIKDVLDEVTSYIQERLNFVDKILQ